MSAPRPPVALLRPHAQLRGIAAAILLLLVIAATPPAAAQDDRRCFPETSFCIAGPIRAYWERNGGLLRFGLPLGPPAEEHIEGRSYTVQYFERRRLELHPEHAGTPYAVQLGLLGRAVWELERRPPPTSRPWATRQ